MTDTTSIKTPTPLTSGDFTAAEEPFVLEIDGKAFTKDYEAFRNEVKKQLARGGGDEPESSLQGLALAARQPFRNTWAPS